MTETATIVIDLPEGTPAEEAARALNEPGEGYFLVQVLPVLGGHRAYLRRYKQTSTKTETASATASAVDNATALSILRANRAKPLRDIVDLLGRAGIKRGRQWVSEQLDATCAEDGREEEALAFLKGYDPGYEAKDLIAELRYFPVKRSAAWVRQKWAELGRPVRADKS